MYVLTLDTVFYTVNNTLQVKALATQVVHASKIAFENPDNQVSKIRLLHN